MAIAKAVGAGWVRANQWVNAYVANEGFLNGPAPEAMRYRSNIRAGDVAIFADVHVKFGAHAITADRSIAEQATDAEWFDADVLIASGTRTGSPTEPREVAEVRAGTNLPVIVGSGLTADLVPSLFPTADGAIVGQWLKRDGRWWNPVDPAARGASDGSCREIPGRAMTLAHGSRRCFRRRGKERPLSCRLRREAPAAPSGVFGATSQAPSSRAAFYRRCRPRDGSCLCAPCSNRMRRTSPTSSTRVSRMTSDMVGAFEAPSLSAALAGTLRLEQARLGAPVLDGMAARSEGILHCAGAWRDGRDHSWGFLALWEWNDAWSAATQSGAPRL